jgi:hypothetical protein
MPQKRNRKKKVKKSKGKKKAGLPFGGLAGRLIPGLDSIAEKLVPKLIEMLPFPTSGTTMSVTPPSMLSAYDRSMRVTAPAANGTYVAGQKARIKSTKTGMRVIHREYFSDVNLPTANFNIAIDQPINPGNRVLFPWLSNIAKQYECYRFRSLIFIYEPGSSSTNDGFVMAAIDFDAQDSPPATKIQMMSYDGHRAVVPWSALAMSCAPYNLRKYPQYYVTDNNTAPPDTDPKTYFVGNLFVATQNDSDPFNGGNMFVQYDVEFLTPQLNAFSGTSSYVIDALQQAGSPFPALEYLIRGGSLNVTIDGLTNDHTSTNSIFDGNPHEFFIPAPGVYFVSINVSSVGAFPNVIISTTGPPFGINEASIYVTDAAGNANERFFNFYVTQSVGPVWLEMTVQNVTTSFVGDIFVTISPVDNDTFQALIPFFSPPILTVMSVASKARRGISLHPSNKQLADLQARRPKLALTNSVSLSS